MTVRVAEAGRLKAREIARPEGFRVEFVRAWRQALARWNVSASSTPFQDYRWLEAWYAAFADLPKVEPLIAIVSLATTSEPVALLPLVRRVHNGVRIVEFADFNLTDYNAPLLTAAAPRDATAARALWRDLLVALQRSPGGADLIRLRKMPVDLPGRPNPLALLDGARPCPLNGNVVTTGDDFDAYRYSLERTVRKNLERSWRVFTRDPAAGFRIVTDRDEALRVLATMAIQQGERMRHLGLNFALDDETSAAFYRHLVGGNVGSGYAVLSMLTSGEEIVATLLGVRSGSRYVMLRCSRSGQKWSNCSPGRLIISCTMAALHEDGVRSFDFSIGNYAYKRRFGVVPLPLADITAALSWRGIPYALRDRAASVLRRYPRLAARVGRLLGKAQTREEN
jgi:CelD/BcsL family acetyltransferase involved in cellulose biosynthesis